MFDLSHNLLGEISFRDGARTVAANGDATVDLANYRGALIVIASGTVTDGTLYTFELKDSPDNSTFTAVIDSNLSGGGPAAGDLEPGFAAADDNHIHWFGYIGTKRYLRIDLATVTGSPSTGGHFLGIVIKGFKSTQPVV